MYSSSVASIACKVSSENHKKQHFTFLKLWCPRMFVCAELHITLFFAIFVLASEHLDPPKANKIMMAKNKQTG